MLNVLGNLKQMCDGVPRRDFLQIGGLSAFFGLQMAEANRMQALAAEEAATRAINFGKAKSCILLFPYGSPSSHETFDPKPEAPVEIRGEMGSINSNVPGIDICEHLPRIANVMDKVTVVRSMVHQYPLHGLAYAVTGLPLYEISLETAARDPRQWPFIGSVVDYITQQRHSLDINQIPNNVVLPWMVNSKTDLPAVNGGAFAAYLGERYDPVWTDFDGPGLNIAPKNTVNQTKRFKNPFGGTTPEGRFRMSESAELQQGVTVGRLKQRKSLLEQFEDSRRSLDQSTRVQAMDHQRQLAMSLLTSNKMREALDIGRESRSLRDRYGMNLFGQACLAARRLIEAGGKFVTVYWDCYGQFANGSWDTHQYHYPRMYELLMPGFDLAYSALLEDLEQRGMLDDTLVLWMSEHGRTPKINSKPGGGRDHWSRAYSVALAGGGAARGKIVGSTTPDGGDVSDTPVSPKDILATTYHLLGIDPHTTVNDRQSRPHPIAGNGQLRPELLG